MNEEKSLTLPNQEGTVRLPDEFLGGMSFIRYRMDLDRDLFINDVSGEEKQELLVRISGVNFERLHMDEEATLLCVSRDAKASKDGVVCECCPNINNSPFMDAEETQSRYVKACAAASIQNAPAWNNKSRCSFRMVLRWIEEFERNADGSYTWIQQPGICYLSCGKSSIAAMVFRGGVGYLSKLQAKGYGDIKYVVTAIRIGKRKNEQLKRNYSYETFDLEGAYEAITKKCVNATEMAPVKEALQGVDTSNLNLPEKKAEATKKPLVAGKTVVEGETVPVKPPVQPVKAQEQPATQPPATEKPAVNVLASKIKMKQIFNSLPAEVQPIVLGVLKIQSLDQLKESDIQVALETVEMAQQEVANQTPAPAGQQGGTKKPW